ATTSLELKGVISDETGSGALVFATSPTLVTPVLGAATATSINKVALTAPATAATLTILDNKTATFNNSITFAGTDSTTMTFPTTSATLARTDAANAFTGSQSFNLSGGTPNRAFELFTNDAGVTSASYGAYAYGDGTINTYHGGLFHGLLVNGSVASPTQGKANQIVTGVGGYVYTTGGSFTTGSPASCHYVLLEDATATAHGTCINWYTTPIGSSHTARVNSLTLTPDGTIWGKDSSTG